MKNGMLFVQLLMALVKYLMSVEIEERIDKIPLLELG
jgi:hypothetical protein